MSVAKPSFHRREPHVVPDSRPVTTGCVSEIRGKRIPGQRHGARGPGGSP
jgi:hypothetical protein